MPTVASHSNRVVIRGTKTDPAWLDRVLHWQLKLFPNAKEISETMAVWEAYRKACKPYTHMLLMTSGPGGASSVH